MTNKIICLTLITLFFGCQEKSIDEKFDYQPVLDSVENDFQKKLDTGRWMLQTSRKYRLESDSLLNLIFDKTMKLENINADSLKITQQKFLSERKKIEDSLWEEIDIIFAEQGMSPELERMTSYGYIGSMNMDRAAEINRILQNQDN